MTSTDIPSFVVCVDNGGYDASLEIWKIYETIPDSSAEGTNMIRVIDDSGEDYLYPADYFMPIDLPRDVLAALRRAS